MMANKMQVPCATDELNFINIGGGWGGWVKLLLEEEKYSMMPISYGLKLCRDKDKKLGNKRVDSSMAGKLHLNCQKKVSGLCDLPLHDHNATVVVHFFCGEKTLLVPADDGQQNFIPRDSIGRAHAENVGGYLNVGRKREVIVGYSQRQALALLIFITRQALTATARKVRTKDKRKISTHSASVTGEQGQWGWEKDNVDLHTVSILQPSTSIALEMDIY